MNDQGLLIISIMTEKWFRQFPFIFNFTTKHVYASVKYLSCSKLVSILLTQSDIIWNEFSQLRKDAGIL